MKTLSTLRYFLFAIMVLGCFANFAQNEYGFRMLSLTHFGIAMIFFTEAIVLLRKEFPEGKLRAFYLFFEHLLLGCIFFGYFLKFERVSFAAAVNLLGSFLLIILYLVFGIRFLIKEFRHGKLLASVIFLFIITTILAIVGLSFKIMHLPGGYVMMCSAVIGLLLFISFSFIKRKYIYKDTHITLYKRLMLLPGKPVMVFSYFAVWVIYIFMIMWDVAPNFYTRSTPPVVDQLRQKEYDRADLYMNNYNDFFDEYNEKK